MSHRVRSRWGFTLSTNYTFNPANSHFSDLISFYGQAYLPGFVRLNSVKVAATYQTSLGGSKYPSGYSPLSYRSTPHSPRIHLGGHSVRTTSRPCRSITSCRYGAPRRYRVGDLHQAYRLNAGGDCAVPRRGTRCLAADLVRGRRSRRRFQRLPPACVGHLDLQTVVLQAFERLRWFAASVRLPF